MFYQGEEIFIEHKELLSHQKVIAWYIGYLIDNDLQENKPILEFKIEFKDMMMVLVDNYKQKLTKTQLETGIRYFVTNKAYILCEDEELYSYFLNSFEFKNKSIFIIKPSLYFAYYCLGVYLSDSYEIDSVCSFLKEIKCDLGKIIARKLFNKKVNTKDNDKSINIMRYTKSNIVFMHTK